MISQRREAEVRTLEALLCHASASASASSHASPLAAAAALGRGVVTTTAATTPTALATPAAASRCGAHGAPSPWAEVYVPFTASRPVAASRLTTPAPDTHARPPVASPAPAAAAAAAALMFADLPASAAAAATADDQHDPKPPPDSQVAAALGGAAGSAGGSVGGSAGDVDGAPQRTLPGAFLPAGFEPTSPNTLFGELKKHKAEEHKASASELTAEQPPPPPPASVGPGMPGGAVAPAAAATGAAGVLSFCPAAEVASFEVASRGGAQCAQEEARRAEAEAEAEAEARTAHGTVPPEAAAEATAARMHMLIKSLVRYSPDAAHPLRTPPRTPLRTSLSAPSPHPLRTLSSGAVTAARHSAAHGRGGDGGDGGARRRGGVRAIRREPTWLADSVGASRGRSCAEEGIGARWGRVGC